MSSKLLKSSEFVDESDLNSETESEEDTDSDTAVKLPAKAPSAVHTSVGSKEDASSSGNSSVSHESEPDGREDSTDDGSSSDQSDNTESGNSESDSEEGSSDEPDEEMEDTVDDTERTKFNSLGSSSLPTPKTQARVGTLVDYVPPTGFEPMADLAPEDVKLWERFSSANLQGKQIWHITAPAKISITSIKRVSMQDVRQGKPSLSLKGQDYVFVQDTADNTPKLAMPSINEKVYRTNRRGIDMSLHLQQLVTLPGQAKDRMTRPVASKQNVPAKKPIREQPKGLKMRFRPIGFGSGQIGSIGSSPSPTYAQESSDEESSATDTTRSPTRTRVSVGITGTRETSDEESSAMDTPHTVKKAPVPVVSKRKLAEVNGKEKTNGKLTTHEGLDKKVKLSNPTTNGHKTGLKEAVPAVDGAIAVAPSLSNRSSKPAVNRAISNKGSKNKRPATQTNVAHVEQLPETTTKLVSGADSNPRKMTPILPPSRTVGK